MQRRLSSFIGNPSISISGVLCLHKLDAAHESIHIMDVVDLEQKQRTQIDEVSLHT